MQHLHQTHVLQHLAGFITNEFVAFIVISRGINAGSSHISLGYSCHPSTITMGIDFGKRKQKLIADELSQLSLPNLLARKAHQIARTKSPQNCTLQHPFLPE